MKKTVALVGAYERDNFGDLLFAYTTEYYLKDYNVMLTAPLRGSVDHLMSQPVQDYRDAFAESEEIDAVWSVGGQLAGARPHSPGYNYPGTPPRTGVGLESPYIPRPTQYPLISTVPYIVNSIGAVGAHRDDIFQAARVKQAIREADYVSVRDRASLRAMEAFGVRSIAAPDVVHTIRRFVPQQPKEDTVLVQFAESHFKEGELEKLVEWLANSRILETSKIVFWAAGLAPNHDSIDLYRRVRTEVLARKATAQIEILEERHPLEIVKTISSAKLVICSSLHARIVSASYNIPRVSLFRPKVQTYASDWDWEMPVGATPENLEELCVQALSMSRDSSGDRSLLLAEKNIENALTHLRLALQEPAEVRMRRRLQSLSEFSRDLQVAYNRQQIRSKNG